MTQKKFLLKYQYGDFCKGHNLGDEIQSLAAKQFIGEPDKYICREQLDVVGDKGKLILNGWFMNGGHWPPSDNLDPLFIAFHVRKESRALVGSEASIAYLKRHEPIGCRDRETANFLSDLGINTYYSKCLTLTFPKRPNPPKNGQVYIVGVPDYMEKAIPRKVRKQAIQVSQKIMLPFDIDNTCKLQLAQRLLDQYRDRASLIITTKLHCALPCLAMGIPVVFLRDSRHKKKDYRTKIVDDFIKVSTVRTCKLFGRRFCLPGWFINWSPEAVDIEIEKEAIRSKVYDWLDR